ncbi:MAG: GWxTD domain-containing protein [Candidatus Aminicenantes bacterium]|nr:GWxTD domain-containing protein [Candidatus Aminicenantes bacterium]
MNDRRFSAGALILVPVAALVMSLSSCRLHRLERRLDPVNAQFLSQVRYIITPEERKIFLELPDPEKARFKEEFWERRDPDPGTEENEFREEYFRRIERANEIFPSEGRPGWLTDRGRIYVLFGPPLDRLTNPVFERSERCSEVWYYGNFPVVFVDRYCNGEFGLVTYDLTSLRDQNLAYMHDLNRAQVLVQKMDSPKSPLFDFVWHVKKISITPSRIEAVVRLEIRYIDIWFESVGSRFETVLDVHLELKGREGKVLWEHKDSIALSLTGEELKQKRNSRHVWEIPILLENGPDALGEDRNTLSIRLRNQTGGEVLRKVTDFTD